MKRDDILALPKVELHCHLDGSVPMHTLEELAEQEGIPKESMKGAIAPADSGNLKDYLATFEVILPLLQTSENLEKAAYAVVEAASREQVVYLEMRFGPLLHQRKGLSTQEVIQAAYTGMKRATEDFPIEAGLIVCALRHHSEERNTQLFKEVAELPEGMVAAIDVAGDEANFPNAHVQLAVGEAREQSLAMTIHSGECGSASNVSSAMSMGSRRIGHGVAIKDDHKVLEAVRQKGVLLELCPTSNIQTRAIPSFKDYPVRYFMEQGIDISINTDNRTVSNTTMTDELMLLVEHCGLTVSEIGQLTRTAMQHAFADEQVKEHVFRQIEAGFGEKQIS